MKTLTVAILALVFGSVSAQAASVEALDAVLKKVKPNFTEIRESATHHVRAFSRLHSRSG